MCAPIQSPFVAAAETCASRPRVADVFRRHAADYRATHVLTPDQARVLAAVQVCRTPALGGIIEQCKTCGYTHTFYHSCRDRHCPTCQAESQRVWIEQRMDRVLATRHFHVVFTVPEKLRRVALRNGAVFYSAMFAAVAETLASFARRKLGAVLGITAVLHTWTRELLYHPHVHCIVTAGGLADDGVTWVPIRGRYLFPNRALAKVFRLILRRLLMDAFTHGDLDLGGDCVDLANRKAFRAFLRSLYRSKWVVFSQASLAGPDKVFKYLGQYTHRVGISDHRIIEVTDEHVTFRTRGQDRVTVTPDEFIRRFLLHVLPSGFRKIRHYGLYAPANVNTKLAAARAVLPTPPPAAKDPVATAADEQPAREHKRCPRCGGTLIMTDLAPLRPPRRPPTLTSIDTS